MDLETISNLVLDSNFGMDEIKHEDNVNDTSQDIDSNPIKMEVETEESPPSDEGGELSHYGVLGMKWGVRKDKYARVKKRDRRYEGESDQDYQRRMERESQERKAKIESKAREKQQKREIKDRAASQKRTLKSQEKQQKAQIKAQENQKKLEIAERKRQEAVRQKEEEQRRKTAKEEARKAAKEKTKSKPVNARNLTDRELNDAINRLRNEQTYKQLSLQNEKLPKKTLVKAATIGGGILLAVGTAVAKQQLTAVGNMKAEKFLKDKYGIDTSKAKGGKMSEERVKEIFEAMFEERK